MRQNWTDICFGGLVKSSNMKTRIFTVCLCMLLMTSSTPLFASINTKDRRSLKKEAAAMTADQKAARLETIRARVEEIKSIDKSTLSRSEKKALKKELREMNREARTMRGGVYLSVGAIIIIILVLILIL